jgi:hypothetical protein
MGILYIAVPLVVVSAGIAAAPLALAMRLPQIGVLAGARGFAVWLALVWITQAWLGKGWTHRTGVLILVRWDVPLSHTYPLRVWGP